MLLTLSQAKGKRESLHIIRVAGCKTILSAFIIVPVPSYSNYLLCPNCRSQVPPNSNCCNICGTPLRQPLLLRICSSCKTQIPATSNFCPECGARAGLLDRLDICPFGPSFSIITSFTRAREVVINPEHWFVHFISNQ